MYHYIRRVFENQNLLLDCQSTGHSFNSFFLVFQNTDPGEDPPHIPCGYHFLYRVIPHRMRIDIHYFSFRLIFPDPSTYQLFKFFSSDGTEVPVYSRLIRSHRIYSLFVYERNEAHRRRILFLLAFVGSDDWPIRLPNLIGPLLQAAVALLTILPYASISSTE